MSNTTAINTAAVAVVALEAALDAVRAAYDLGKGAWCPRFAAALAGLEAALEMANQSLDDAIAADSVDWTPGACERIVAGV